jgi:hypothetical protein
MYTRVAVPKTSPPTMPLPAPSLIAGLLGVGSFLPVAARSLRAADAGGTWLLAWAIALGLALVATVRRRWPSWTHPAAGGSWLLAGVLGAAVLLRHGADSLAVAAAEAPWSAGRALGLDLGAWTLLGAFVLLCLPAALLRVLRAVRPGLLVPSAVGLAFALAPVLAAVGRGGPLPTAGGGDLPAAILLAATLAWTAALVGPAALPLRAGRSLPDRAAPRLVLAAAHLALPAALLAGAGASAWKGSGASALAPLGARALGRWGTEIAAGLETGASLLGALVLVLLAARVGSRRLPRLRAASVPLMGAAAGLLAGWLSTQALLLAALVGGWLAVALGPEEAPWVPAGRGGIEGA